MSNLFDKIGTGINHIDDLLFDQRGDPQDDPLYIAFILVPKFSFFALACCSEPLRVANRLNNNNNFKFIFLSEDGQAVMASNDMAINVDYKVSDCPDEYKTVIVISGFDPLQESGKLLLNSLKRLAYKGVRLGAVDTGAHILASAGLLNSKKAIVHWESNSGFKEIFPEDKVILDRYVIEEKRMFSAGGLCCLDMMLNIYWQPL